MMKEEKTVPAHTAEKVTPGQYFIKEWKRRKSEDEKTFLQEINSPEHIKKMETIRGKIVTNGTSSA